MKAADLRRVSAYGADSKYWISDKIFYQKKIIKKGL